MPLTQSLLNNGKTGTSFLFQSRPETLHCFKYDAWGNLIRRTETGLNGTAVSDERFAVDGWDTAKMTPVGNEQFDTWADVDAGGNVLTRRLFGAGFDDVVARLQGGVVSWYGTDRQGSVRTIFDNSGGIIASSDFDAWGNVTAGALTDRYGFTGLDWDGFTRLWMPANGRPYDADIGRWLAGDEKGFDAGDVNLSRYVGNAPTNGVDPSGYWVYATENDRWFWDDLAGGAGKLKYRTLGDWGETIIVTPLDRSEEVHNRIVEGLRARNVPEHRIVQTMNALYGGKREASLTADGSLGDSDVIVSGHASSVTTKGEQNARRRGWEQTRALENPSYWAAIKEGLIYSGEHYVYPVNDAVYSMAPVSNIPSAFRTAVNGDFGKAGLYMVPYGTNEIHRREDAAKYQAAGGDPLSSNVLAGARNTPVPGPRFVLSGIAIAEGESNSPELIGKGIDAKLNGLDYTGHGTIMLLEGAGARGLSPKVPSAAEARFAREVARWQQGVAANRADRMLSNTVRGLEESSAARQAGRNPLKELFDQYNSATGAPAAGRYRPDRFNSVADPIGELLGPASKSHPDEFARIMKHLDDLGVEVQPSPGEAGYIPARGQPGTLRFDPDWSISALRHEYRHVLDDLAADPPHPGLGHYYRNPDLFWRFEFRAYSEEFWFYKETYNALGRSAQSAEAVEKILTHTRLEKYRRLGDDAWSHLPQGRADLARQRLIKQAEQFGIPLPEGLKR